MKHTLIALLLCAVGGCASRPAPFILPVVLTCGSAEAGMQQIMTPNVQFRVLGPSVASPDRLRVRQDMIALVQAGKLKAALALGETQLASKEALPDAGSIDQGGLAELITEISELRQALRRMGPAEAGYLRAIALYSEMQDKSPEMLRPTVDLAILYRSQGKPALALPLQLDAYPKLLAWLGPEHPDVIESEGELARLHLKLKQYDEAEALFQARLERAKLAGDKVAIANSRKALAQIRHARPVKRAG